jgi:hypothetical protein
LAEHLTPSSSPRLVINGCLQRRTSPTFVDPALAHDEITLRLIQVLMFRYVPRHARPFASLPVIDLSRYGDHEKSTLFVVFCLIFAVSPSSAELAWCSCFTNFRSFDTSVSLFPPFLLRLAGGTGGIWLNIFEILSFRETRLTTRVPPGGCRTLTYLPPREITVPKIEGILGGQLTRPAYRQKSGS